MHFVGNVTQSNSMSTSIRRLLLSISAACSSAMMWAQLSATSGLTPIQLVNDVLAGQGVAVSNVTFNGGPGISTNQQIGTFNGINSNLGLTNGIVLATGRVELVTGPNQNPSLTVPPTSPVNVPDPDLAMVSHNQKCVAVLEFDFIPTGDSISFRFVFGSEEYPEFVCSMFNDAFGFFLSGPGIAGPYSNNAINIALVPGTNVPVAINSVNNGSPGFSGPNGCNAYDPNWQLNAQYFVPNTNGATVELDGFTVPLMAKAAVLCGEVYHIKMAIAHIGDNTLDSAVLIEGGSFSSESHVNVAVETPMNNGVIHEGCRPATITIEAPIQPIDALVQLSFTGNGITNNDVELPSQSITIPAGATSASFPLSAIEDEITEGTETLWIHATWTSRCGTSVTDSVSLNISEYIPMDIVTWDVYLQCDQDSVRLDALVSGGVGTISLTWSDGTVGASTYVSGTMNGTHGVTATDECPRSISDVVKVDAGCGLFIPNVITPNQDGSNDAWVIGGLYRTQHRVTVFNRWGQVIFESTNYNNNWRAQGVSDGTYFYEVITDRSEQPAKGSLTILGNSGR